MRRRSSGSRAACRAGARRALSALLGLALLGPPAGAADLMPYWNARFGSPLKLSAGVGVLIGNGRGEGFDLGTRAVLVELQPGLGGGALSLGFAPVHAGASGFTFAGIALKASLLRTWGSPLGLPPDQTYLGAGLHLAWIVQASVGFAHRISGSQGPTTSFTWSVGLGL